MIINIEVPDLAVLLVPPIDGKEPAVIGRATISDLYFEDGDEIEEGQLFAVLVHDNGTCELAAPASGVVISLRYAEGDTVTPEAVLAEIQTDR